eukprot:gnl/TRDRNA2_/TRDRNA2_201310_c0_seq1.p1 gnl/TRDRNA2_/TRDRNA2_201310_c0~~gnl/TRDRNA2_/TRDRNA2_201310_c0_seq1.p1  ORF type:complete len:658 (+),score=68.84 gnl/TRDRNA2_/TRDRNA2_201310_c0_seq1:36-1976(+)
MGVPGPGPSTPMVNTNGSNVIEMERSFTPIPDLSPPVEARYDVMEVSESLSASNNENGSCAAGLPKMSPRLIMSPRSEYARALLLHTPSDFNSSCEEESPLLNEAPAVNGARHRASTPRQPGHPRRGNSWEPLHPIPDMAAGKAYIRWMLPTFIVCFTVAIVVPASIVFPDPIAKVPVVMEMIQWVPWQVIAGGFLTGLVRMPIRYVFHYYRLRNSCAVPEKPPEKSRPLLHVIVVPAYKEPLEVLERTFETIAAQEGLRRPAMAVFASEARDETRYQTYKALKALCADRIKLLLTEHVLEDGEAAGKASNENFAVRELHRVLDEQAIDPFEVMVTIADADSLLSKTYCAHLESFFYTQRDGRRMIYDGPLNTYRNFACGNLLTQYVELARCHNNTFFDPFVMNWQPLSNYSLTLGFAAEIGYWTVDCIPEDVHTSQKAMINNFGTISTIQIPPIICNDLVESTVDRYIQAKRHMWGVLDITWIVAVLRDMPGGFRSWYGLGRSSLVREDSIFVVPFCMAADIWGLYFAYLIGLVWRELSPLCRTYILLSLVQAVWAQIWFWTGEFILWRTLLKQFPIERPSVFRWLILIILGPVLRIVCTFLFHYIPVVDVILHATFVGDLAYVKAPKGKEKEDSLDDARISSSL